MADKDNSTAIVVAVIGVLGVVAAALISNWDKLFIHASATSPPSTATTVAPPQVDMSGPQPPRAAPTDSATPRPPAVQSIVLGKTVFSFPGDGKKNKNQAIGPFCCTAETATVQSSAGQAVGYIYYFDSDGGLNNIGNRTAYPNIKILVSGASDLAAPTSSQVQDSIVFTSGRSQRGDQKTVIAGRLMFIATLMTVTQSDVAPAYFDTDAMSVNVEVKIVSP